MMKFKRELTTFMIINKYICKTIEIRKNMNFFVAASIQKYHSALGMIYGHVHVVNKVSDHPHKKVNRRALVATFPKGTRMV